MKKLSLILILLFLSAGFTFGVVWDNNAAEEALIEEVKIKADKVKEGDWKALADCAKTLLEKRINYGEVKDWLEKSVSVKETWYNVSLMGDYYVNTRDFDKAYENYIKAIRLAHLDGKPDKVGAIQWKLLVAMGTKNYYDFMANKKNN